MGFPKRIGEKRYLSPLVEHGDSNPVFDITCFLRRWVRFPFVERDGCSIYL